MKIEITNYLVILCFVCQITSLSLSAQTKVSKSSDKKVQGNLTGKHPEGIPYPIRNDTAGKYDEVVTLRYSKIKKGTFPLWLKVSQEGVWPYFEKLGARVVGAWQVIPVPDVNGYVAPAEYDEIYLMTRYANLDHWRATRDPIALGGNGPDYEKSKKALKIREDITIESTVQFLHGSMAQNGPYYLPGLKEEYQIKNK